MMGLGKHTITIAITGTNMLKIKRIFKFLAILLAIGVASALGLTVLDYINPALDQAERARLKAAKLAHEFIDLPSGTTHYRLEGPPDGPVVVLVHGFSTPLFVFDDIVPDLVAAGYRVLAYDHYGRGFSDRPHGAFDADMPDRQINELLDAMKITSPVHLVGYSMGGAVATIFAARHKEKLASLALIAPAGLDLPGIPFFVSVPGLGRIIARLAGHQIWAQVGLDSAPDAPDPARFAGNYLIQSRYRGYPEALNSTLHHFPLTRAQAEYDQVGASGLPVLAIWGKADTTVPFTDWDEVKRRVPQAELAAFDNLGHEITYAKPKLVAETLIQFWAGMRQRP